MASWITSYISDIIGCEPAVSSIFFSSSDNLDRKVEKISDYKERLVNFIEKNIHQCLDYIHPMALHNFKECCNDIRKRLTFLLDILLVDNRRHKACVDCDNLWAEFMKECENLNSFANHYLRGYDDDYHINFKMNRWYGGQEEGFRLANKLLNELEESKKSFEKNLNDNIDFMGQSFNHYHL